MRRDTSLSTTNSRSSISQFVYDLIILLCPTEWSKRNCTWIITAPSDVICVIPHDWRTSTSSKKFIHQSLESLVQCEMRDLSCPCRAGNVVKKKKMTIINFLKLSFKWFRQDVMSKVSLECDPMSWRRTSIGLFRKFDSVCPVCLDVLPFWKWYGPLKKMKQHSRGWQKSQIAPFVRVLCMVKRVNSPTIRGFSGVGLSSLFFRRKMGKNSNKRT